jgi:hypothetical protein
MLHYFKFRRNMAGPQPAREVYTKRGPGRGWPEECPPLRAANAYGFDLVANFDLTFMQSRGRWRVQEDVVISSDFSWSGREGSPGAPLSQQYAWFWEQGQKLPHPISDNVYAEISNQVKVSTYLFIKTDPNELMYMTDVPNLHRPWRALSALVDTDWYPASHPWHVVLELGRKQEQITIRKGEPLCRVIPVRRDTFFAQAMSADAFDEFFNRSQRWLNTHGRPGIEGGPGGAQGKVLDITRTYVKQQIKSKFVVVG